MTLFTSLWTQSNSEKGILYCLLPEERLYYKIGALGGLEWLLNLLTWFSLGYKRMHEGKTKTKQHKQPSNDNWQLIIIMTVNDDSLIIMTSLINITQGLNLQLKLSLEAIFQVNGGQKSKLLSINKLVFLFFYFLPKECLDTRHSGIYMPYTTL